MCVFLFVCVHVCVLIGSKGGKQISKVHIKCFSKKPFIFADENYYIPCICFSQLHPNSAMYTNLNFLNLLNLHIRKC